MTRPSKIRCLALPAALLGIALSVPPVFAAPNERWAIDPSYGVGGLMSVSVPEDTFSSVHGSDYFTDSTGVLALVNGQEPGRPLVRFSPTGVPVGISTIAPDLSSALDGASRLVGADALGRPVFAGGGGLDRATPTMGLDSSFRQTPQYTGRRTLTAVAKGSLAAPLVASANVRSRALVDGQVQRFRDDGSLDPTFGSNGTISTG